MVRDIYQPTFRRVFSALALTPSKLTTVAVLVAVSAYLVPILTTHPERLGAPLIVAVPALAFAPFWGRVVYVAAALNMLAMALACGSWFGAGAVLIGLGGALTAIAVAHDRVGTDRAFDNFDHLLAVTAVALCWSAIGAWLAALDADSLRGGAAFGVPRSVLGAVAFGLAISPVVLVGDARRLIWLRRLISGRLAGYAVKVGPQRIDESDSTELPALMGGGPADAVLVVHQSIPSLPFRTGWRETVVARMPVDPQRLVRRARLRLFAVGLATVVQVALAVPALLPHMCGVR